MRARYRPAQARSLARNDAVGAGAAGAILLVVPIVPGVVRQPVEHRVEPVARCRGFGFDLRGFGDSAASPPDRGRGAGIRWRRRTAVVVARVVGSRPRSSPASSVGDCGATIGGRGCGGTDRERESAEIRFRLDPGLVVRCGVGVDDRTGVVAITEAIVPRPIDLL